MRGLGSSGVWEIFVPGVGEGTHYKYEIKTQPVSYTHLDVYKRQIPLFKYKIPHYQARHIYRPGMTGWAQVNGWRGNTDLEERIRHDIWYLENWSVWLDFRIMLQTLFRRENAY